VLLVGWSIWRRGDASMVDAVREAAEGGAVAHYALMRLRFIANDLDLQGWEQYRYRTRRDAHAVFRRAIGQLTPHRGGWNVARSH
jgi:hypothetical protein